MTSSSPPPPARVLVCGGGVIGAATAYFLALHPSAPRVTLLEKSSVASAASGKAGGFLALDWCDSGPLRSLARASFALHRSLAEELGGAREYGYRPLNTLSMTLEEGAGGGGSGSGSKVPAWVDGRVRHPSTIGTVESTAQVHPGLFTKKLVSTAVARSGMEVVIGEVEQVELEGGRVVGVSIKMGMDGCKISIPADAVVLALGPWSGRNPLISELFRVSSRKAHSIVLRPSQPEAISAHALFLSYLPSGGAKTLDPEVYPRPTGEVYICGMSEEAEVPDDPEEIVGEPEPIDMLHKIAGTLSSHLAAKGKDKDAQIVAEQACFLPLTDDGIPVIGEIPGTKGCYVATGHSCWGILNGPATGAALAELILDGCTKTVDLTPFSPARFLRRRT